MFVEILDREFLNNQVLDYIIACAIILIGLITINIVRAFFLQSLKRWAKRTTTTLDDKLIHISEKALIPVLYLGTIYLAIDKLNLHPILERTLDAILTIIATIFVIQLLSNISEYLLRLYLVRQDNPNLMQSFRAIMPAIRIALWAVGFVFLLDNLGFDISALVASLGIGGVAIALASQGLLQDLFSYFSILLDRPFELGDFIVIGDYMGTVDNIGIKTTRLTSLTGEELIISNADLTASRLRNFKRMEKRRIVFKIGVVYQTSPEELKAIPEIIKKIITSIPEATFDRVHFSDYGDFSLNYEIVYFVNNNDYTVYMDIQQNINLALFQAFAENGIEFAYPTHVTYLQPTDSEKVLAKE
ncbi:mechanosensitive ion channel family protein [Spirulina sp. 06S082]|uniref:mechanosensitive ion channel family protein n=1 Tax=Spirulina sp. 06S082 TaxID=3110248 RepID=UPI002B1ECE82|nr:mechanosensitive ion channel family protein [Spirulina sp. 06S082]MEA5471011.1 mechanosensitive ion channel family protein [Spirulina sp. 06S082]